MQVMYAFSTAVAETRVGKARWQEPPEVSLGTDVFFGYDFYSKDEEGKGPSGQWFDVWHTRKPMQWWWSSKPSDWERMGWAYWDDVSYCFTTGSKLLGYRGIAVRKTRAETRAQRRKNRRIAYNERVARRARL